MEPLHDAEFASHRYFQKLNQSPGQNVARESRDSDASSSTFILPLRSSKPVDVDRPSETKRAEKKRFGLRYLRSQRSAQPDHLDTTTGVKSHPKSSPRLDHLLLGLPNEIQTQILSALPLSDILNLRLVSKSFHDTVTVNEAPIARYHLDHHIPAYALRLYPVSGPSDINLHYLCSLWHRLHVAAKLAHLMCESATKEIFLRTSDHLRREFAPQRERMRRRLIPILFTIFHFFETYRKFHLDHLEGGNGDRLHQRPPGASNPIEAKIMNMYDDQTLLRVHQAFPFVISSFCRRMRPPSYTGRVERSFRGYLREKPPDEVHVAILFIGGLRQVEKLWEVKGYNQRRVAVDDWYRSLGGNSLEPSSASKPRRTFMGLGRKKSMVFGDGAAKHPESPPPPLPDFATPGALSRQRSVFHTSLAAGMPMRALPPDQALGLLSDLPPLQQIWLATAQSLILERRIVERAQDIKRNAEVMLDLIREDGFEEEDQWWYGCGASDSLRPPAEATEDDPEGI